MEREQKFKLVAEALRAIHKAHTSNDLRACRVAEVTFTKSLARLDSQEIQMLLDAFTQYFKWHDFSED